MPPHTTPSFTAVVGGPRRGERFANIVRWERVVTKVLFFRRPPSSDAPLHTQDCRGGASALRHRPLRTVRLPVWSWVSKTRCFVPGVRYSPGPTGPGCWTDSYTDMWVSGYRSPSEVFTTLEGLGGLPSAVQVRGFVTSPTEDSVRPWVDQRQRMTFHGPCTQEKSPSNNPLAHGSFVGSRFGHEVHPQTRGDFLSK